MYITDTGEILLNIGEAAKEIGVVPATIRNWEKNGIFTPKRTNSGYRCFDYEDMTKLRRLVKLAREKKISVGTASGIVQNSTEETPVHSAPKILRSEKWKQYRLNRGFVLEDVAGAINISPSYLHKIENEPTNVSLGILQRLADFYGENILYYIAETEDENHIVRKKSKETIDIGIEGVTVTPLVAMSKFNLSAMLYTIEAHCGRTVPQSHQGEEFVYVLFGKVHFKLGNTSYVLSAGDSLSFRSTESHVWFNHQKKSAQLLWIYTPTQSEIADNSVHADKDAMQTYVAE